MLVSLGVTLPRHKLPSSSLVSGYNASLELRCSRQCSLALGRSDVAISRLFQLFPITWA